MKHRVLALILILFLLIPTVKADYLYDSVETTAGTGSLTLGDNHPANDGYSSYGYYFTPGANVMLHNVQWFLSKSGSPTVELYTQIYAAVAHKPNGAALATSNVLYGNNLTSTLTLYDFWFNSTERVNLVGGNEYCVVLIAGAGTIDKTTNKIYVRYDGSPLVGDPGLTYYTSGGGGMWGSDASRSPVFYAYAYNASAPVVEDYVKTGASGDSSEFQVNITIQDDNEYGNLATCDFAFNVSDDSQYFTLRWTQLTDTFSEVSDVGGICTLNDGYSTVIDYQTIKLTYEFTVSSLAVNGTAAIVVTVTDDDALSVVENYVNYVTSWEWGIIGDVIDSAFELFGISNYMSSAASFISTLASNFTNSLVGLAQLIALQFTIIWNVFSWGLAWATRMINGIVNIGGTMRNILNGLATGTVNIWTFFNFNAWIDGIPIFLIVYWIDSMAKRARTQGTLQVLYGDLNAFANVFAFFTGIFGAVVSYIEGKVSWLFQALPL